MRENGNLGNNKRKRKNWKQRIEWRTCKKMERFEWKKWERIKNNGKNKRNNKEWKKRKE